METQRLAPLPVAPVWEICMYDYYLVLFQTIQDATQSLSIEQIFQHFVSWLLPPCSLQHLKYSLLFFFHVKGFLEVGHNIHSLWNENTSCVQDGKKNPWLSRKLYELIKNKSTHYACYSAKWKIPSLLLRLVGCFVCSRHLFPVSSTFSSLVQLGIKY